MRLVERDVRTAMRVIFLAAMCSGALGLHARADETDQFSAVRARIAKALVDHNIPSVSVAVAKDGKILWEEGFGWADRENRVAATQHTLYSLASISKPITATGLMILKQRGKLDLDKPADDYLGSAKLTARVGTTADATIRRIANHTSGLPLHYQFFYADEAYRAPSRDETIRRFGNLVSAPGERFQYSNLGYGVLDYIIERSSGKKFAEFMREEVFLPLGLTHMSINLDPALESHQAIRYTPGGTRIPFYDFDHPGASAAYASAHDLVRFAMFHMKEHLSDQRPILSDESIDEMQQPTSVGDSHYGIGWGASDRNGRRVVSHSGGMPGVATLCTLVPSDRLAVVVLTNTSSPLPGTLSGMILNSLLPSTPSEAKAAAAEPAKATEEPKSETEASALGTWKGYVTTYRGDVPLTLEIKDLHDVHVKLGSELAMLLSGAVFHEGNLRGQFAGELPVEEARGRHCHLHLDAKLRGDVLNGSLTVMTLPDGRGNNATTHWVELKRKAPPQAAAATAP